MAKLGNISFDLTSQRVLVYNTPFIDKYTYVVIFNKN